MKQRPDLDIFYLYTGIHYSGDRSQILRHALSDNRTRELVWLYLAVNEIPWKRIRPPKRFAAYYLAQGHKAAQLGSLWRTTTQYWLGHPFRVWYSRQTRFPDVKVGRTEEQRWRESIWLRRRQLTSSSVRLKRRHAALPR